MNALRERTSEAKLTRVVSGKRDRSALHVLPHPRQGLRQRGPGFVLSKAVLL
jgi:hypothetical protein